MIMEALETKAQVTSYNKKFISPYNQGKEENLVWKKPPL